MQALASRGSAPGGRRGALPGVGVPASFAASGAALKFREFGASPPALRRGRNDLGGARARRAARLAARARKGRPRATAFSPAAAQPLLAAAGARGARAFPCCGRRRGRHMPSAAPRPSARRGTGRPRLRAEPPAAPRLKVSASEAVSRGGWLRRRGGGGAGVSEPLRERADPAGSRQRPARLSGHVHNFAPPRSGRRAAGAGTSEPSGRGASWAPGSGGMPSRGPEPGAVRD